MTREEIINEVNKRGAKIIDSSDSLLKVQFEHKDRAVWFHWKMLHEEINSYWSGENVLLISL